VPITDKKTFIPVLKKLFH